VTTDDNSFDTPPVNSSSPQNTESSVVTPDLEEAVKLWSLQGFAPFFNLMNSLHDADIVKEPLIKTLIFNIFGGYLLSFNLAYLEHKDVALAHSDAFNELMNDPALSQMANNFMRDTVNSQISKVVK
tara:strand:- start:38 stop:418 length:381 start_codon:yes stop_codon:yes gene_type:complete